MLETRTAVSQKRPRTNRSSSARRNVCLAQQKSVVILPGLGNNSTDYTKLKEDLLRRGCSAVEVAPVRRIDWARNAAGLMDGKYWTGTLKPRPTVDWYLERIQLAVNAVQSSAEGAPITLLAHSAGGWLGRLYLLDYGTAGIDTFISLGSPHLPPPKEVVDQTRGILTFINDVTPGAYHKELTYVTVGGRWLKGAPLQGPGPWQARIVGAGYQQVCGRADVWGDGVVPVEAAHLEGALNITIDGAFHSPLGSVDGGAPDPLESDSDAEAFGMAIHNNNSDDENAISPMQAAASVASETRPRYWYGSSPIISKWINELL